MGEISLNNTIWFLVALASVLSPQRDLMYNVGGAINTLTQTGTACALVLLVNVTRPSL